ncbi:MAG: molybdopterin-dependent oxidoreductase [Cyclobacteriaceae bacterium]|nr:molybdopterin-dependent oxidoreductase [Cyclobacteriaceae bacterium]
MSQIKKHFRTCNLCEAMCGLVIEHQGNQIVSIKGDPEDPFSQGHICPKAVALQDLHQDPDRLRKPVKKVNGRWKEIAWPEAYDLVTNGIKEVQQKYGNDAVALYQGNPSVHNMGSMLYGPAFARSLKTRNKFSASSVDQLPHHVVSQHMFGHLMMIPVPDIDRTHYLLMLGANPMVSNGSLMTCGGFPRRLKALQDRGGKMVVIDPRYSETAAKAHKHLFIKPGTDALLLLEMVKTLIQDGMEPPEKLLGMTQGWQQLLDLVKLLPEDLCPNTGIDKASAQQLAREFAAAETAVCYGRMGVSTQPHGSLVQWLIHILNLITGNFDQPGGAMFTKPAVDIAKALGKNGTERKQGRFASRIRQLPEFFGELPVAALLEEIITPGEGQIKALITSAGNPVLSTPQGHDLGEALKTLEFQVAIDIYINETTRHAQVILPPTTGLETDHYDLAFHTFAVRDFTKFSTALIKPADDTQHDWQIFKTLTHRLDSIGRKKGRWWQRAFVRWSTPRRLLDLALRFGPYGQLNSWKPGGLTLSRLRSKPHGIDLGALKPCLPARLFTNNKCIQLVPDFISLDITKLLSYGQAENSQLLLIGRRQLRSNNSWMHNIPRLMKGAERCTLLMNPRDAASRHLQHGQKVQVTSRVGSIPITLEISEQMMPGVVSIPHGWGHQTTETLSVAQSHGGSSINDLTDTLELDGPSGNAAFSGIRVEVE